MTKLFVAGATGFLGRALARQDAAQHGVELVLQARPGARGRAQLGDDPRVREVDLTDQDALCTAMVGCDAVLQLIGTQRARVEEVGGYEAVDYDTTVQIVAAAQRTGEVRHLMHLSAIGAGRPIGEYLTWKRRAEQVVLASGLDATIVRPSWIGGDKDFPERPGHEGLGAFLRGLSDTAVSSWVINFRPINVQVLARVLLLIARDRAPLGVVKGRALWEIAREHHLYPWVG